MIFEIIPKNIAQTVDQIKFNVDIQVVNKDPVVRIFNNEQDDFSYYTRGEIPSSDLLDTNTVLLLDHSHPQNQVTGFSIVDTATGQGKLFMVVMLLTVILGANYFIFFREKESRDKLFKTIINAKDSIKIKSTEEKLTLLLNSIIDELNVGLTSQAITKYPSVLEMFEKVNPSYKKELKPIIEHLYFELEVYNINKQIEQSYKKTITGKWFEAVDSFQELKQDIQYIPNKFHNKINKNLKKLDLAMDIHMMKEHNVNLEKGNTVDDSLFQVKR